ncbi:MAG TPA: carboxypeptidase-like regulatory domain-containing protein [Candidatus Acidoferrales bacterium]|nr:carboxypeptidase-like regulatory domain-containing protein [Candidatus Acidoferrales bacterium]
MKQTFLALLLCAIAAGAISAAIRSDDGGMGTLAGTVVNAQGKPVANASVTMQNADGQSPHAATTNRQGRFFFPDLPHGYYDVRASTHTARSEWKHNVEIVTGKQTEVTLRLVPKPH